MNFLLNFQAFMVKWIIIFNLGGYCLIMVLTNMFIESSKRVTVMGWICSVYSVAVFASPLTIMVCSSTRNRFNFFLVMQETSFVWIYKSRVINELQRHVIRTKSVEHMPFSLSFFLTLCAAVWFFYGFFIKDFYIAVSHSKINHSFLLHRTKHETVYKYMVFVCSGAKCVGIFAWNITNDPLSHIQEWKQGC